MKITRKELMILGVTLIVLLIYMRKQNQQSSGGGGTTVNRAFQDMDNAQQELYSWVAEGEDELGEMWDEEINGAKVLFYNDK